MKSLFKNLFNNNIKDYNKTACPHCDGTGGTFYIECQHCFGMGIILVKENIINEEKNETN